MIEEPIQDLIRRPESQVFEWKKSLSLHHKGLQSLCGMLNADQAQGIVIFGIAPDGTLVGVEPGDLDKAQRSLSQAIDGKFEPRPQCTIRAAEAECKRFVLLAARRNPDIPYHEYDGIAFIREGTVTRRLSLVEKQSLTRTRSRHLHPGPWKCDRCASYVRTLAAIVVTDTGVRNSYHCHCGGEYWPA